MIEIRDAEKEDDYALIKLQKRCPMGTSLIIQYDSSPSYFNRSKHQAENHIIVAVEKGEIVGSASCAISTRRISGTYVRTAYNYGLMVDPGHRRKGIATLLTERCEEIAKEADAKLIYNQITESNIPSILVQKKRGFKHVKDAIVYLIMVFKPQSLSGIGSIRTAKESDLSQIVDLINNTHSDYDLYHPYNTDEFKRLVESRAYFDLSNILVYEREGELKACLGYWDYNKVMQMTVLRFSLKHKLTSLALGFLGLFTRMPKIPRPGEPFTWYILTDVGFIDSTDLEELVKKVNNIALDNDTRFLNMIGVEEPIKDVLSIFMHTTSTEYVYAKVLEVLDLSGLGENKIYLTMQ